MTRLAVLVALALALAPPASADSSATGTFVDLRFSGLLRTDSSWSVDTAITDQVRYTLGQLNGVGAGSRLGRLIVSQVESRRVGGHTEITYAAVLPAIWRRTPPVPRSVELVLPLDVSFGAQKAFATKYGGTCVDFGAHDVDAGSMFFYYRPAKSGCRIDAPDVYRAFATLSPSKSQTTGKYPEYDRIWADGTLNVVAVFGKYERAATTSSDAGIAAYNTFISMMKAELARPFATVPAQVPSSPGVGTPDIQFTAGLPGGRKIDVAVLLADDLGGSVASTAFRARYDALSTRADLIVFNGHLGVGASLRSVGAAGRWVRGQYAIVFMNGPDTWSLLERDFLNARRSLNADDPTGSRYLDIVANGMPAYFTSMSAATMALFRGLAARDTPKTFEQILASVDANQLAAVTGEQDNVFVFHAVEPAAWEGLSDSGTVTKTQSRHWSTPTLPPGSYTFTLTGTGGDADLYVRIGSPPTTSSYDCRPAKNGSNETCLVQLAQPRTIHVMVRGYANSSTFQIAGKRD